MIKFKLKYTFFVFLYAYLRQINLSLDRSRWDDGLNGLRAFYSNQILPERVIDFFQKQFKLKPNVRFANYLPKEISIIKQRMLANYFFFSRKYFLKEVEIFYCCQLLLRFKELLSSDLQEYTLDMEKLRLDVSNFSSSVIESKLLNKDIQHAMSIEHYLQHKEMKPIDEFMDGIDL